MARQVGIMKATQRPEAQLARVPQPVSDWATLVATGAVQRLVVKPEQVGLAHTGQPFIELWFGDLNHPDLGGALLGQSQLAKPACATQGGRTCFVCDPHRGAESFKGSGFVRWHL